jgi:glycosyltransferase involved in cell wall biosynthesis
MINDYSVNSKDIIVYPSGGVDVEFFKNIDTIEAKQNIYLDPKYKYIGYVSRIDADKGYDTFIEAVNILSKNKKYDKYKFVVVGNGNEYNKLEKLIKDYELYERVSLNRSLDRDDLVSLYNALDLFVFPTRRKSDSLGLVGLEAMACETLTITSDAKGPLSYAKDKKNAYVFKQDDPEDLVKTIETVIALDDTAKDKLRKNARKTAMEYDSTNMDSILFKAFK